MQKIRIATARYNLRVNTFFARLINRNLMCVFIAFFVVLIMCHVV